MPIDSRLSYLEKHRFTDRQIGSLPAPGLSMVVVIPSFAEPDIVKTLRSLATCELPSGAVEVIVVFNASEQCDSDQLRIHGESLQTAKNWCETYNGSIRFHLLNFPALPPRHAGVGLARKIGMDEAVDRLEQVNRPEGIIVCLDADSQVVPDYLLEIEKAFGRHPRAEAASIHFEHPLEGSEYDPDIYRGIIRYELFLRYYIQALRFAKYPYAMHTVGSSMAVRSAAYQKRGGMNRRKAGEDFYFLHKFIPEGRVIEITDTCVIPSPRAADKVPFGTGRAILHWLAGDRAWYPAYSLNTFRDLKQLCEIVPALYTSELPTLPDSIIRFLEVEGFRDRLPKLRQHVASREAFIKRFFQWFDGLKVLKYVHFARDHFFRDVAVTEAAAELAKELGIDGPSSSQADEYARRLLRTYRKLDLGISADQ